MSYNVYTLLNAPADHKYKLIQLPPELVAYMKESGKPLQFKSPLNSKTQLVICTDSATYNVRQMNHSNTQLIVNDMAVNVLGKSMVPPDAKALLAIGLSTYQYELTTTSGHIDVLGVPVYAGSQTIELGSKTVEEVKNDSPIAEADFERYWYDLCGSEVQGKAVILSPAVVTDVLYTIVSVLLAKQWKLFTLKQIHASVIEQDAKLTENIVTTVVRKFCTQNEGLHELKTADIAKWFGIETLRKQTSPLSDRELMLAWKSSLPPYFNASLDLKLLYGHFCRPQVGCLRYIDMAALSTDVHARVKEMFTISKEWEYDEFVPFVAEFVPAAKKVDYIIMKYARKKRVGKKVTICPR